MVWYTTGLAWEFPVPAIFYGLPEDSNGRRCGVPPRNRWWAPRGSKVS